MDPIKLQKQLRDNNSDLQAFCNDIKSWGEEMKRKEQSLKNVAEIIKNKPKQIKVKKIKKKVEVPKPKSKAPKDFAYWENFDVEGECNKIDKLDEEDDSDASDEFDEELMKVAIEEKEKGNKFVKMGRWEDAINAYTSAIEKYKLDQTYYCNRSLCYLKLDLFKSAESDCTIALQLDKKYVKALHRRALARVGLKQHNEAKADLLKILEIEPYNKESQKLLDTIETRTIKAQNPGCSKWSSNSGEQHQKAVSKFTAGRNKLSTSTLNEAQLDNNIATSNKNIEPAKNHNINGNDIKINDSVQWPAGCNVEIINTYQKKPKHRSQVPLKRVEVQENTLKYVK